MNTRNIKNQLKIKPRTKEKLKDSSDPANLQVQFRGGAPGIVTKQGRIVPDQRKQCIKGDARSLFEPDTFTKQVIAKEHLRPALTEETFKGEWEEWDWEPSGPSNSNSF
jgi:hypothetical protein